MALDILTPPVGGQFGPGFRVALETTVIGPLPIDTTWQVWIHPVGEETDLRYVDGLTQATHSVNWDWGAQLSAQMPLQNISAPVLHGQTVRLLAERREGGTLVETLSQDVVWNMTDGIPLWQDRRLPNQIRGTGLTTQQAAQLAAVDEATIVRMGAGPDLINFGLSALIPRPPFAFMEIEPLGFAIEGSGELPGDPGLTPIYYGWWWEFTSVPPGLGLSIGVNERWPVRMLQLRVMHSLHDVEVCSETVDADFHRILFFYANALPERTLYTVYPGVTANIHRIRKAPVDPG